MTAKSIAVSSILIPPVIFDNQIMYGHVGRAYGFLGDFFLDLEHNKGFVFLVNGYYNNDYIIGENSSFFKIEEDVFSLMKKIFYDENQELISFLGKEIYNHKSKRMYFFKKENNVIKKIFFE